MEARGDEHRGLQIRYPAHDRRADQRRPPGMDRPLSEVARDLYPAWARPPGARTSGVSRPGEERDSLGRRQVVNARLAIPLLTVTFAMAQQAPQVTMDGATY